MARTLTTESDSNRYVVSARHDGSIYPASRQELLRQVFISRGAHVTGAAFGQQVALASGCRVDGPVYATMSLTFDVSSTGVIQLGAGAGARRSLLVDPSGVVSESPKVQVLGDVFGPSIRLSNAVVAGNIAGREVYLDRCLVLGGVLASGVFDCTRSIAGWFWAESASLTDCGLIVAFGCATRTIQVRTPVRCLGLDDLRCLEDVDAPIDRHNGNEAVMLTQDDVEQVQYVDPSTRASQEFAVLSAQTRAWDLTTLSETARRNADRILNLLLPAAGGDGGKNDRVYEVLNTAFERLL